MIDAHLHITHRGRNAEQTIAHIGGIGAEKAVLMPIEDGGREYGWESEDVVRLYPNRPQQCLYFLPLPQGHGSFRPGGLARAAPLA